MSQKRERELLHEIDRLAFVVSGTLILILIAVYFWVESSSIVQSVRDLILGIVVNLIPVFLAVIVSYALFRRIQNIKSEHESDELATKIASSLQQSQKQAPMQEGAIFNRPMELLVRNAETNLIYIIDHNGLHHPIPDEDTAQYFMEVLGYQPDEISTVLAPSLKPLGPEVKPFRSWSRPRTKEDDMSFEAQGYLRLLRRRVRTDSGTRSLSFYITNNSEHRMQITSAQLVLMPDSPLSVHDVASINNPTQRGLAMCHLLFDGESRSKELSPQEKARLDLFLSRNLSPDDASTIETVSLGHIAIIGIYRDTTIEFHMQC